jgi:hypothetical protein
MWHIGLLYKLRLSIPLNYLFILKSYLQSRHFLVKIENFIHAGVPLDHYYIYYLPLTSQLHQKLHRQVSQMILQSWP